MILLSNTKMLTGLIAVFVLSYTSLVGGQGLSGNEVIIQLHSLSYIYEDFTVSPLYKSLNPLQTSFIAVSWDIGSRYSISEDGCNLTPSETQQQLS